MARPAAWWLCTTIPIPPFLLLPGTKGLAGCAVAELPCPGSTRPRIPALAGSQGVQRPWQIQGFFAARNRSASPVLPRRAGAQHDRSDCALQQPVQHRVEPTRHHRPDQLHERPIKSRDKRLTVAANGGQPSLAPNHFCTIKQRWLSCQRACLSPRLRLSPARALQYFL